MGWLFYFFFNDTATTEIYTLSLHDALPIYGADQVGTRCRAVAPPQLAPLVAAEGGEEDRAVDVGQLLRVRPPATRDRKSTRLNSSHANISYAVFCLKKKQNSTQVQHDRKIT